MTAEINQYASGMKYPTEASATNELGTNVIQAGPDLATDIGQPWGVAFTVHIQRK